MKKYGYTLYSLLKTSYSYMINSSYRPRDVFISGYFIFHISPTFPHICLFHVDHNTFRSLLYHLILRPMKVQVYEKYTQYCGNRVVISNPIRQSNPNRQTKTDRQCNFRQSRLAIPSQNKKSCKATHKPTHFCSTFYFAQTHQCHPTVLC